MATGIVTRRNKAGHKRISVIVKESGDLIFEKQRCFIMAEFNIWIAWRTPETNTETTSPRSSG